jgi:hypothetical protein
MFFFRRIRQETLALFKKTIYCLWLRIVLLKCSVSAVMADSLKNSPIKGYAGWERENYETREKANQAASKHFRPFRG